MACASICVCACVYVFCMFQLSERFNRKQRKSTKSNNKNNYTRTKALATYARTHICIHTYTQIDERARKCIYIQTFHLQVKCTAIKRNCKLSAQIEKKHNCIQKQQNKKKKKSIDIELQKRQQQSTTTIVNGFFLTLAILLLLCLFATYFNLISVPCAFLT